ncbi:histidinol-phosphate aminotransferase [Xenorhabdus sp. PR6a]|uniref:inositol monophosphatase family protein n=1 Tax=Xenorhabdus sp. PR6a TaxID=3025877 RepID=UPI00235A3F59|nr:inositol monophosphatase family protein [Xenorhabdus sp. PR6a]MDC9582842.1 histidinol-phosphate aminotransferase [Xenorhabdus sp. PR6a]
MLNIAIQAVKKTRQFTVDSYNSAKIFEIKTDKTLVTRTDLNVENQIRKFLSIKTPNIPILGEEFGTDINGNFNTGWVIDPIDGTRAFLYGVPLFSTLISYVENNEPLIGVISFPALEKIFYASQGEGCWVQHGNNVPVKISIVPNNEKKLQDSVISASGIHSTTFDRREGTKAYNLSNIVHTARDTIFINDCYQHAMVSMGRIDAAIDTLMKPWDIAALIPCMRESGVVCANLQGSREQLLYGGSLITASSQSLLDELIYALN